MGLLQSGQTASRSKGLGGKGLGFNLPGTHFGQATNPNSSISDCKPKTTTAVGQAPGVSAYPAPRLRGSEHGADRQDAVLPAGLLSRCASR
jgi:hypothetical protein